MKHCASSSAARRGGAERAFAALTEKSVSDAYNDLQYLVQDYVDVHRVVLAWRAWSLLDLAGKENAHTLLRQSVRFCCDEEKHARNDALRALFPDCSRPRACWTTSTRNVIATDEWIEKLSHTIYASTRQQAAEAAAQALAEGFSAEAVGEAISLAANQLVLHDPGRKKADSDKKPIGSVHGASVGVHASDAANAWRNIARVSNRRNTVASMIVGAYHTAGQTNGLNPKPYPFAEHREKVRRSHPTNCCPRPRPPSRPRTRSEPVRWSIATASCAGPSGGVRYAASLRDQRRRRSACREVLSHGHAKSSPLRGLPSAGTISPAWPA